MKEINGFPGYFVTPDGRVYSNRKYNGNLKGELRELSAREGTYGYKEVNLYKDGKGKTHKVHRLVAEAYIKQPPNCNSVNHIDENKLNNHVDNLEWLNIDANNAYSKLTFWFIEDKNGETFTTSNLRSWCKKNGADHSNMQATYAGRQKWHKGYRLVSKRKPSTEERDAYVSAAILSATTG